MTVNPQDPTDEIPARTARMPGIPVDFAGGPTIDPTKNVLDLVRAESKYQDSMREIVRNFQDQMREVLSKHHEQMLATNKEQQGLARAHDITFQNYA
ncbi:MAG TPA: hypothetical protein VNU19_07415, partial [Candidatus Acidoferrum sp.]|nr:hypothetical protein [Candidatus Acidoferrum sp.]